MAIRPRTALIGATACLVLLVLVWFAAFHVGFFQHADQKIYVQFGDVGDHGWVASVAGHLVSLFDPGSFILVALVPVVVALLRRRPWMLLAVGAILLGANLTTEVLKHLLAAPRPGAFLGGISTLPANSWPSGHSTAAMSLMMATVLVVPSRLRPLVAAVGTLLAIAVGYSVLATGIHYPSDVLGGFLVATIWSLATVAALRGVERWRPAGDPVPVRAVLGAPGVVLAGALVLTFVYLISRPQGAVSYARAHEAFVIGAAGIGALGLTLSTGVLLSIRR